jgi:putative RecB family exonuclease
MIATVEPAAARGPRSLDELRETVSASRLNTWLSCRLKFYFRYVLGLSKPRGAALYVGHTVHGVLKLWNQARWRRQVLTAEALKRQFKTLWRSDQKREPVRWEDGEELGEQQTACSLLDLYFRESPIPPNEKPEAVEVSVEADLAKHGLPKLFGILDLVRAGGRIVDYKTVGQTPRDEKAIHTNEVQLSGYAVLYRANTGKTEGGRDLHQLVKTKAPKLVVTQQGPMTEPQQTRLFRQMESYAEGLSRQDFVPSPGMQCSMCSFQTECRRWS